MLPATWSDNLSNGRGTPIRLYRVSATGEVDQAKAPDVDGVRMPVTKAVARRKKCQRQEDAE